jgi:hypothetical protein
MRSGNFDPHPWHLVPLEPGYRANLGRSGVVIILVLAILVVGVFFAVLVPPAFLN